MAYIRAKANDHVPARSKACDHIHDKGCYTPIEDNQTNVDRTFVFPLG